MVDLSLSDENRIRDIIAQQLRSLSSLDGEAALKALTPEKRRQGTGAEFLRSLAHAYPQLVQVWRMEFGALRAHPRGFAQHVRVLAHDRSHLDAVYLVQRQEDGSFLIEGCMLRRRATAAEAAALPN